MMRAITGITRIFVGLLFIISGLIKLNDPVGFSFKLDEYFSAEVLNLPFLEPYALLLAVSVVIFEVMLGVMIIVGYARRFTLWSLLLMIVFFTFLTFYSAYFNKVTDCGCFGDAMKMTPWQSFGKDVVLLVLILLLFAGRKYLQPIGTAFFRSIAVFVSLIGCLGLGYYVLQHLPVVDFRPYHIGANIPEGMSVPEGAPEAIFEYRWRFEKDGVEEIVVTQGDYPDHPGTFIDVETTELQAGYEPPIHDFSMERDGEDLTDTWMSQDKLIIIVAYNLEQTNPEGYRNVQELLLRGRNEGYRAIGLSASSTEQTIEFTQQYGLDLDFYFCDETTLKTMVRSNPGIMVLSSGTIMDKRHWNDAGKIDLSPRAN